MDPPQRKKAQCKAPTPSSVHPYASILPSILTRKSFGSGRVVADADADAVPLGSGLVKQDIS